MKFYTLNGMTFETIVAEKNSEIIDAFSDLEEKLAYCEPREVRMIASAILFKSSDRKIFLIIKGDEMENGISEKSLALMAREYIEESPSTFIESCPGIIATLFSYHLGVPYRFISFA